jgi:hypothetical protein
MSTTFKDLSDQQRKNFEESVRKVGLDPASAKAVVIDKPCEINGDAARSHLKPHKVIVRDVAHMKELAGISDSLFASGGASDDHIPYPKPLNAERQRVLHTATKDTDTLHATLTAEERQAVNDAGRSYVLGNSAKVPEHYVPLVNAAQYPQQGNVVAAPDITIKERTVFAGPDPQKLIAGTLTIVKPNGEIVAQCPLTIEAQYVVVQGA